MTLAEILTQRLPLSERTKQPELVLPDTIPEPFFDIASHCLRRDPQRRWTVAEIAARLQRMPVAATGKETAKPRGTFARWGYIGATVAAGFLLWAIVSPRLLNRHSSAGPASSSAVESSKHPPEPVQGAGTGQSARIPRDKKQAPGVSTSSNTPPAPAKNVVAKNSHADLVPGAVAQQVSPEVSRYARNTIHGKVRVRVKVMVDSSGNVLGAKFDSRGPSKYFAERALQAARQWTFKPPQADGQSVPSEWILKFEFGRTATNVHPAQTSP
jgi:TonB family protein